MSFPRYPKYKPSGVEWLGEVPEHWEVLPIRALARSGRNTFVDGDWIEAPFITDDGIRFLQTGNVGVGMFREQGFRYVSEATFVELDCTAIEPNDVLICRLADPVGRACLAPNLGLRMITSVDVCILKAHSGVDPRFVVFLFCSAEYLGYMEGQCRGGTRDRVSRSFLGAVRVPVPPFAEQTLIAAFLDRETAKIDELVSEQERLMALLKEKRQAVISHAVTKGLNPAVRMKPSGIEWLGDVPEHWRVGKCGFYLSILSGFAFPSAGFSDDETGTKLLRGTNVGVARLKWNETVYWRRAPDDGLDIYEMHAGDIVIGMDRPLISEGMRVAKVKTSDLPCLLLQRVASLKTDRRLDADYLLSLLSSEMFVAHFSPETTGVSVPHISPELINEFVIPLPPVTEQMAIVEFVTIETAKLDTLTAEAQRAIDLLQERRTALISAAVTGQIDVRGARA